MTSSSDSPDAESPADQPSSSSSDASSPNTPSLPASAPAPASLELFLDVGSTNSRAWLLRDGAIVQRRTAAIGVRDSARDGSTDRVRAAVRDLIAGLIIDDRISVLDALGAPVVPLRIAAAGMITSSLGLADVPHVAAPAGIEDLARGAVVLDVPDVVDVPIVLVPGVRTVGQADDALTHDVMRGEETLVFGLLALGLLAPGGALLNAGSHWKLIRVDEQGRIAGSRTSLGGEVVHAVHSGTILSAALPEGPLSVFSPEWLEAGAAAARREGLLRALFGVRLLEQHAARAIAARDGEPAAKIGTDASAARATNATTSATAAGSSGASTPADRLAFMIGACIADDLDALRRSEAIAPGMRLLVSGPAAVPAAWAHLLRATGCDAVVLDADTIERAFVTGLTAIERVRASI